jgi:hypothetical protein
VNWAGNHANYDIMPLLLSFTQLYKNAHSSLLSDCENNHGLETDGIIAEYGLEVHNRAISTTFAGAGPNNTVNYSVLDITLL